MSHNCDCAILEERPAPDLPSSDPHTEVPVCDANAPVSVSAPSAGASPSADARSLYTHLYRRVGNREAAEALTSAVARQAIASPLPEQDAVAADRRQARLRQLADAAVRAYWRGSRGAPPLVIDAARARGDRASLVRLDGEARARDEATSLLGRLPETYRTVLSYRVVQGMSVAEVAQRMAVSEDDVKALQYRALAYASGLRGAE